MWEWHSLCLDKLFLVTFLRIVHLPLHDLHVQLVWCGTFHVVNNYLLSDSEITSVLYRI